MNDRNDRFTAHTARDDLDISVRQELDAVAYALEFARKQILAERIMRQKEFSA